MHDNKQQFAKSSRMTDCFCTGETAGSLVSKIRWICTFSCVKHRHKWKQHG